MKKLLMILPLVFLLFFIIACQPSETPELTDSQRQEIASEIRQTYQDMVELAKNFTEENFNKLFNLWVESNDESWLGNPALWVSNIQIIPTLEKLDEVWRPVIGRRASEEREMTDDYVAVLSHDHAIHILKAKSIITDIDGNKHVNLMTATTVYVKKNGVWRILHYHQSWTPEKQETQAEKETEK